MEVTSVLEVSGTEERGTKLSICKQPLCDRLRDGALSCPGQSVQPVDGRLAEVPRPVFNSVQDGSASSLEATPMVAMSILNSLCATKLVEGGCLSCRRFASGALGWKQKMF